MPMSFSSDPQVHDPDVRNVTAGAQVAGSQEPDWPQPAPDFLASFDPEAPFPLDPAVQVGRLSNGLTYYIAPNADPPDRALFSLVVAAGALEEEDDQVGIAHFLEHMLFNGTENFSEGELRSYFEAVGMTFGQHLNAGTGHEQTVYYLDVDASNREVLDTTLTVLGDWASRALLTQEEINREKGVVIEEWRLRQENAAGRIQERVVKSLLAGSRYADRNIIGDVDLIRTLNAEAVRGFYEKWYRPDLMTLVIVGAVDSSWLVPRIEAEFGSLRAEVDAPVPARPPIPLKEATSVEILTDPELPFVSLEVVQLLKFEPADKLRDARRILIHDLTLLMFNERLQRLARSPETAFQGSWLGQGNLGIGGTSLVSLNTHLDERSMVQGFSEALTELQRARRFGFTEGELRRAKLNLLEEFQRELEALPTRSSHDIRSDMLNHLLLRWSMSGIAFECELARHYLPDIRLKEVDAFMAKLLDFDKSLVLLTGPEKDGISYPEEGELRRLLAQVEDLELQAHVDDLDSEARLLEVVPDPVDPLERIHDERLDLTVLEFGNGVTALLRPTNLEENQVLFEIASRGGLSRVEDSDFVSASLVTRTMQESGAGPFGCDALDSLMTGTSVGLEPFISQLAEGYSGSAARDDLETLFQLAHLQICEPRLDEAPFRSVHSNLTVARRNQELDPSFQFNCKVQEILYGDSIRERPCTMAELEAASFSAALQAHEQCLRTLDSPTLILVGDFDLENAVSLVCRYMGTLPDGNRHAGWQDRLPRARPGPIREYLYAGKASQVFVFQAFVNEEMPKLDRVERNCLYALSRILEIRYDRRLREELSSTYFANVSVGALQEPRPRGGLTVFFGTNEARVEELTAASVEILRDILESGVTDTETATAKSQMRHDLENSQATNGYWHSVLQAEFIFGERELAPIHRGLERIFSINADRINALAPLVIDPEALVEVIQLPLDSRPQDAQ